MSASVVRESGRQLWSFAAVGVLGQSINRIGVIVLSVQVGASAAGVYATGLKLVELGCMPLFYIGMAAYPWLCQAFVEEARFERLARHATAVGIALALLVASVMYLAVPLLLVPLLGEGYAGSEPVIAAMAAIVFAQGTEIAIGRLLLAANLSVARAARVGLGAIVCVVATVIVTPAYGIYATIAAAVLSYLIVDLLYAGTLFGTLRRRMYATA
jgi:O-antigen/teichoic acid export membrane protein